MRRIPRISPLTLEEGAFRRVWHLYERTWLVKAKSLRRGKSARINRGNRQTKSMIRAITFLLILALDTQTVAASTPDVGLALPPVAVKRWTVQTPDSIDWDGDAYSSDDWYARIRKGDLIIEDRPEAVASTLPFKIEPINNKQGEIELFGVQHVIEVGNGYLVGFSAGEFGGGAWWFSKKGDRRRKLTLRVGDSSTDYFPENVRNLVTFGKDVLAFEGLTHLVGNSGQVVRLHRGPDGEWRASLFAKLKACPYAVLQERPSTWLLATTSGIFRIDGNARVMPVWQPRGGHLYYPNSLVRDDAGVVYMGMRSFVIRLTPQKADTYIVAVLVPSKHQQGGTEK